MQMPEVTRAGGRIARTVDRGEVLRWMDLEHSRVGRLDVDEGSV